MKQVIIFDNMDISCTLGHNAPDLSELNMYNAFHVMIDYKWARCIVALFSVKTAKIAKTPMTAIKTSFNAYDSAKQLNPEKTIVKVK